MTIMTGLMFMANTDMVPITCSLFWLPRYLVSSDVYDSLVIHLVFNLDAGVGGFAVAEDRAGGGKAL